MTGSRKLRSFAWRRSTPGWFAALILQAALVSCGSGSLPDARERRGDEDAAPASAETARMLAFAMSTAASGMNDACFDSATSAMPRQRFWVDILFFDRGRHVAMADDSIFHALGQRFYRAAPAGTGRVRLPKVVLANGNRIRPGWWPSYACAQRVSFRTPLVDEDMSFVVAESRWLIQTWVFLRSDGRWHFLAYGHTRKGGIVF